MDLVQQQSNNTILVVFHGQGYMSYIKLVYMNPLYQDSTGNTGLRG